MATVLLVDDSPMDLRLAEGLLKKNPDLEVLCAIDAEDALAQFEDRVPDVVVTDLVMPGMSGLELASALKSDHPLVPVIIMTGKGSEEVAVDALRQGAASYVSKSKLARDLHDTVIKVLAASHEDRTFTRLMHRISQTQTSFVIDNDVSLIHSLVKYLQQMTRCLPLADETERVRVGIALEEAILNAFYHGNLEISSELREVDYRAYEDLAKQRCGELPYCDRRIYVDATLSREAAVFTVHDEGPGFDPAKLPDPTEPANLEKPSGRGVLLMRTFMDEVEYNERGNSVRLVKRVSTELVGGNGR